LKHKSHFHYNARATKSFFMEDNVSFEVALKVRKALPEDLKIDARTLRMGQVFWLRSKQTGDFMNQPLKLDDETDVAELAGWLANDMIYVPVKWRETFSDKETDDDVQ